MTLETYANTIQTATDGQSVQTAGMNFLESIHHEIDQTDVAELTRHCAINRDDALAAIKLAHIQRNEITENEDRQQDKENIAFVVNPA